MNKLIWLLLLVSPALGLTGCDCGGDNYPSDCLLSSDASRFDTEIVFLSQLVDTSGGEDDAVTADLFAGTQSAALFADRGYSTTGEGGTASLRLNDSQQQVAFSLHRSRDDSVLVSNAGAVLEQSEHYWVLALGTFADVNSFQLATLRRDQQSVAGNRVSIRFLNALAETASPLRVLDGADVVVTSLFFGDNTGYVTANPDNGSLSIELRTQDDQQVATPSCDVQEGGTYLGVLGYAGSDSTADDSIRLYCHRE